MNNSRKTLWNILNHNIVNVFTLSIVVLMVFSIISGSYLYLIPLALALIANIITLVLDLRSYCFVLPKKQRIILITGNKEREVNASSIKAGSYVKVKPGDYLSFYGKIARGFLLVSSNHNGKAFPIKKSVDNHVYYGEVVLDGIAILEVGSTEIVSYLKHNKVKDNNVIKRVRYINELFGLLCAILIIFGLFTGLNENLDLSSIVKTSLLSLPCLFSVLIAAFAIVQAKNKDIKVNEAFATVGTKDFDTLCIDKTGTITDDKYSIYKLVPLINDPLQLALEQPNVVLSQIISNVLRATKEDNPIFQCLNEKYDFEQSRIVELVSPYANNGKYSAASFKGGKTYAIGKYENFSFSNDERVKRTVLEYTSIGYEVLVVVENNSYLENGEIQGKVQGVGVIVLQEHIRENAHLLFENLQSRSINIKVISGDDVLTAYEIARQVGIENAEKKIDIKNIAIEELDYLIDDYVVFGNASIDQKQYIVQYLQKHGHKVAYVGDHDNDTQALKSADVSVAMESGSVNAKKCAQIVIEDLSIETIEKIEKKAKQVHHNVLSASIPFYSQAAFVALFGIAFAIAHLINKEIVNPFNFEALALWTVLGVLIPSGLILFDNFKNEKPLRIYWKTLFSSIGLPAFIVSTILVLQLIQYLAGGYFGFKLDFDDANKALITSNNAYQVCYLALFISSLVIVYNTFPPQGSKYRFIAFLSLVGVASALIVLMLFGVDISLVTGIDMNSLNWPSIYLSGFMALLYSSIYLFIVYIFKTFKGEKHVKD